MAYSCKEKDNACSRRNYRRNIEKNRERARMRKIRVAIERAIHTARIELQYVNVSPVETVV